MKKQCVFLGLIVVILLMVLAVPLQAALDSSDRESLIELYNATDGDNWTNNSGWKNPSLGFAEPGTEDNWYGIEVFLSGILFMDDWVNSIELSSNNLTGSIPGGLSFYYLTSLNLSGNQLSGEIPVCLAIPTLSSLGIGYNALYTNNETLRTFLNSICPNWEETQTIAPKDVSAAAVSSSSIRVSWTIITYVSDSGGYEVYYSTTSGGPWTYAGITADKSTPSYEVTGLNPGTTYYFVIRTRTDPHSRNPNTVISEYSEETSAATLPGPPIYTLTVQSSPDTDAAITVIPNDNNGNGDGATNFTRTYNEGTTVTVTAPAAHNSKNFAKWTIDGVDNTNQTIQVTMDSNHTVTAVYEAAMSTERIALIALYNATNGDNWTNNSGWKEPPLHTDGFAMPGTENNWYGITVSSGQVSNITLINNNLTGAIPPEIGSLSNLQRLYLQENQLSGSIPPELGNLSHLQYLDFFANQLNGSIPPGLGNLSNLISLRLSANQLSGLIPAELGNPGNLHNLELSSNQLSGSIPPGLGNLSNLTRLVLSNNQLSGSIPPELGNLSNLQHLELALTQLSGSIPPELGNLGNLQYLKLSNNQLNGSIPPELGNLCNLQYLFLQSNQLSGDIPSELENNENLLYLYLGGNQLSGSIPTALGNLNNLEHLSLQVNRLSGSIPPELGNLSNLQCLYLYSNRLSGSIPAELGNLSHLQALLIYNNQLSGSIPPELGYLNNLTALWMSDNQLSGSIPPELGNLTQLTQLHLNSNQLSNEIPITLINLTNLDSGSTDIGYNSLYTGDDTLGNFLNSKDPDWENTQTVAPGNISAVAISFSSIRVSWTPIIYTEDSGHYEVYYSTTSGGPWTYAGVTADKSTSSYEVTGLSPGALYYFVIRTRTDPHYGNSNTVISEYSQEVSTATLPGTPIYTLTVQSSPDTGATITVTPNDNNGDGNGTTNFTRIYNEGTTVTLTAPAAYNGKNFLKWMIDDAIETSQTIQVTMNSNHQVIAFYQEESPDTYTLKVESTHGNGAYITVSPADVDGNSDGLTKFTRIYNKGTVVTLTAPGEHNGKKFARWQVDGIEKTNSQTVQVTMDSDHKAKAYYTTPSRPGLVLSRGKLNFGYTIEGELPSSQVLRVTINGDPVDWTATTDVTWLQLNPTSGFGTSEVSVSVDPTGLTKGTYKGTITVSAPEADNSPQSVDVKLNVYKKDETTIPFGEFATPGHGAVVCSSIPVTGWALDDIGVDSVKIYREENGSLIYIGDAVFVEGARPDVEQAYPDYPNNHKAGWGYMMLTNFLPNGGNGTFHIHAVAVDTEGNSITLGIKTITCNNANAVKPFGAIDTPTQGGTASGSNFVNWAWVLAPRSKIPEDGSTINVYVNGIKLGHPTYNIYRSDIAALFPGYANSDGAAGYFYLDTTAYGDGVHTIQWTATDSVGNTDGIGSRYFLIENTAGSKAQSAERQIGTFNVDPHQIPLDYLQPVKTLKGYNENTGLQEIYPDENGVIRIEIEELERLVIDLQECTGFQVVDNQLRSLPIGSTLDSGRGVFYWQPGPGFMGEFWFVFIEREQNDELKKRNVNIIIKAKH